jgi:hypothetical protein
MLCYNYVAVLGISASYCGHTWFWARQGAEQRVDLRQASTYAFARLGASLRHLYPPVLSEV